MDWPLPGPAPDPIPIPGPQNPGDPPVGPLPDWPLPQPEPAPEPAPEPTTSTDTTTTTTTTTTQPPPSAPSSPSSSSTVPPIGGWKQFLIWLAALVILWLVLTSLSEAGYGTFANGLAGLILAGALMFMGKGAITNATKLISA